MILYIIQKTPFLRKFYFNKGGRRFVRKKIKLITPLIDKNGKVLDIGSGNGLAAWLLREQGFDITPLDIHAGQYDERVRPVIYDGEKIPFQDQSFHTGLILTVLHHVKDPEVVLKEAARVCKYVIVMEDIYNNAIQKQLTYLLDDLANLFYSPCPHTNKTDAGWKQTFEKLKLKLVNAQYRHVIFFVRQGIYFLDCSAS